jgi:hypothetical protein
MEIKMCVLYFTWSCGGKIRQISDGPNSFVSMAGGSIEISRFDMPLITRPLNYSVLTRQVQLEKIYIEVRICHGHTA